MFSQEWDLGKKTSGGKKNVCAWIYLCDIMSETEKMIVEKKMVKLLVYVVMQNGILKNIY